MIWEIVRAAVIGGLPVAVFTFVIVQWAVASGRMARLSASGNLRKQYSAVAKSYSKNKDEESSTAPGDILYGKIMFFGGGYYGTMAVLTYAVVELVEIWAFLPVLVDPDTWINRLGIGLIIDFVVNSILNVVAAFTWFTTIPGYIRIENGWVWLAVSYGAYWLALQVVARHGDFLWGRLVALARRES